MSPTFLTVAETAEVLRLSPGTVRRQIHSGALEAYRVGAAGRLRVPREGIENILRPVAATRLAHSRASDNQTAACGFHADTPAAESPTATAAGDPTTEEAPDANDA